MKKFSKFMAALLAGFTAFAAATPVLADGVSAYTPIAGGQISFGKYLVMDADANVPNATFNFTIAPGAAQDASTGNLRVFAGVTGATVGNAVFAPTDTVSDVALPTIGDGIQKATSVDAVDLTGGKVYARKAVPVDLRNCSFPEPGVYRYVITESASTTPGVTNDSDSTRILDVYVADEGGALAIQGYVLHNREADAVIPDDGSLPKFDDGGKAAGFQNNYATHNLTISKRVTGNQGSRDEYFEFTVHITDAIAGTKYKIDLTGADATTKTNTINTEAHTNAGELTADTNGEVTATYWLQNGQSIVIQGLTDGTKYTVAENNTTMNNEGYATTCEPSGDTDATFADASRTASDSTTGIKADTTLPFINDRAGVIPTGLYMTILPGILLVGAACVGIAMYMKKKGALKA